MVAPGRGLALSLLAVGTAAAAGYLLKGGRRRTTGASKADVGARIVEKAPPDATVVDVRSERLQEVPGVRTAIRRALRNDARDEWEHVTLDREGAWHVVDVLRSSLPYYDAGGGYNGVYVHCDGTVLVLDAIGWTRIEEPIW